MSSKRNIISMTSDEIRLYLQSQSRLIIVSNGTDGFPHPMPMNFIFDNEERFLMTTFRKSQKVKNLQRDPKASLLVESGVAYQDLRSVLAYSNAEIIEDKDEVQRTMMLMMKKETEITGIELKGVKEQAQSTIAKRVVLRFKADSYISWDHSKLAGRY
jgi:nitroimidazol reductase NimA-like FMN-containing flavoprotein (pyridoxamine 5'-phosphate oxidase superfamily)